MMMLGKWIPWFPVHESSGEYNIKAYSNTFYEFRIILSKRNTLLDTEMHITWGCLIETYRVMNETYRGRLWHYIYDFNKDVNFRWPLFIVENSEYLKFLSEESEGITDELKFKHYFIVDSAFTMDIGSRIQPKVELFVNGNLIEVSEAKWH
jgi:hypothetical protein